jgi:CHAD domain-containing protein
MFEKLTPIAMFQQQTEILCTQMPGILDGRVDAIHTGRITTRRIRELLPLTHEWQRRQVADDLFITFRRMGRSLGRVRDADVRLELLRYFESRIPPSVPSLVVIRQRQERERLRLMRKLVRRFERLEVECELAQLAKRSARHRTRVWTGISAGWRDRLRRLVAERAQATREAIRHATGVYFPDRSHEARIALKKFRYAAEIAVQAGIMTDDGLIRDLKKRQDVLGELHDRQTLLDHLRTDDAQAEDMAADQIRLVTLVAEAEIGDLHRSFLDRRARLLDSTERTLRDVQRSALPIGTLALAGVVAVASGLEALRRYQLAPRADRRSEPDHAVSVRIPVTLPQASIK